MSFELEGLYKLLLVEAPLTSLSCSLVDLRTHPFYSYSMRNSTAFAAKADR